MRPLKKLLLLLAPMLLTPAGGACSGSCNCPEAVDDVSVEIPAAQSSPIAEVLSNDRACIGTVTGVDSVEVHRIGAGTCQFQVRLANGDTYGFSITVQSMSGGGACDCSIQLVSDQSGPTLISTGDGGTDM